jgi:hypothetical protein|tara:strand:+ start:265 stop:480 length:216 start_codon:yes stop_codon:yes gene_type:complete
LTIAPAKSEGSVDVARAQHAESAKNYFDQAKERAEEGSFREAATLILRGLDQERRSQSAGPQIMQLIKPRI